MVAARYVLRAWFSPVAWARTRDARRGVWLSLICAGPPLRSSRWAGRGWARRTGNGRGGRGFTAPPSASPSEPYQFLQLIIGVIIGPRAEIQLRRALQGGGGDPLHLFSEPMAVATYAVIAVILLWPLIAKLIRRARGANTPKEA
jgi:hypothetical protein